MHQHFGDADAPSAAIQPLGADQNLNLSISVGNILYAVRCSHNIALCHQGAATELCLEIVPDSLGDDSDLKGMR